MFNSCGRKKLWTIKSHFYVTDKQMELRKDLYFLPLPRHLKILCSHILHEKYEILYLRSPFIQSRWRYFHADDNPSYCLLNLLMYFTATHQYVVYYNYRSKCTFEMLQTLNG